MKILDDLSICEQRAVLRAEPHLGGQSTLMQELGKTWWGRKADAYRRMVKTLFDKKHVVLYNGIEQDLSLYYIGKEHIFQLQGKADLVAVASISCGGENEESVPVTIIFEFTMYKHIKVIAPRVIAYASGVYAKHGFLTIPVIVVMKDYEDDLVERMLLLLNKEEAGFSNVLGSCMRRLEKLLSGRAKPRRAPPIICTQCDIELRKRCPYFRA